jgi:hypothetical protein
MQQQSATNLAFSSPQPSQPHHPLRHRETPPSHTPAVVPGVSDWISPSLQTYRPSSAANCRIPRCHPVSTSCLNPYNNYYNFNPHLTLKPSRNIVVRELTHIYNSPSAVHRLTKEDTKFLFYCNDKGTIKGDDKIIWGTLLHIVKNFSEISSTILNCPLIQLTFKGRCHKVLEVKFWYTYRSQCSDCGSLQAGCPCNCDLIAGRYMRCLSSPVLSDRPWGPTSPSFNK